MHVQISYRPADEEYREFTRVYDPATDTCRVVAGNPFSLTPSKKFPPVPASERPTAEITADEFAAMLANDHSFRKHPDAPKYAVVGENETDRWSAAEIAAAAGPSSNE